MKKPEYLTPLKDGIPQELERYTHFVCWKGEWDGNRLTKVPYDPKSDKRSRAKTNDPNTWSNFPTAWDTYENNSFDGIGFVVTENDPFIGIDIDHCINDGEIDQEIINILKNINSYTELSPSGEGIRIFIKGELPEGWRKNGNFEMYSEGRYLTLTGHKLLDYSENIREISAPVLQEIRHEIDDLVKLQKAFTDDERGGKIKELFRGNWEGLYPSQSEADGALCFYLAYIFGKDPQVIDRIFRRSGLFREKWDRVHYSTGETYGGRLVEKAVKKTKGLPFPCTDMGNAERLVACYGEIIRYNYLAKKWLIFNGRYWELDQTGQIYQLAKETVRSIYREAEGANNKDDRKKISAWANRSESERARKDMISSTQSEVPILPDQLDSDHWLFNVRNGTLDLNTGELRPHNKEDFITKMANVEYDENAECPTWVCFLNDIFEMKEDLIRFIQRAIGYSLTGSVVEQCLFFLYGTGANGKSTFLETLLSLFGDYGQQTEFSTFVVKRNPVIRNDVARMKGIRFVSAIEAEIETRLSEALLKTLTGGDKVTARFLFKEFFEFSPILKIFLAANHKPEIRGTDHAIWRRIRLIPFNMKFEGERDDKNLKYKLRRELSGILNWSLQGCAEWKEHGLGIPSEVRDATEEYRNEMDIIGGFLSDCCVISPTAKVLYSKTYDEYTGWSLREGDTPLSKIDFGKRLIERGFRKRRGTGNKLYWHGVGLRTRGEKVQSLF